MNVKKFAIAAGATMLGVVALAGCSTQASTVSDNLSKEADEFKVDRRITFVNGITDEYMLVIEGKCSQTNSGSQL